MTDVITFGCRLNTYESEVIKNITKQKDLQDVAIFNTCAVTQEAERQAVQAIRKYKREHPNKKIIVTGCAAQINPEKYLEMSEVDQVIGNKEKLLKSSYLEEGKGEEEEQTLEPYPLLQGFEHKTRAFVQIQNGCNYRCTFCIVPYARGNSVSTPFEEIAKQVKLFTKQGYKELVLTGVSLTSYGKDLSNKITLGQAIKRLLRLIPALTRIRLSSVDVADIDKDLIDLIYHERKFMPHLHLSLQSGDNEILRKMKRRHSREQVLEFCRAVRKFRPDIAFGADIITGFPTETDEMFENSCSLVKEANIPYLHVFPYSERYDTPAAQMPQIDKKIRKERARILRGVGQRLLDKFSQEHIGKEALILMEKNNTGRTENFLKVHIKDKDIDAGSLIRAKITDYKDKNLIATVLP